MGVFDRFEKGIDRVVNGAFAKAFRSQVEPVELASAIRREADNRAAVVSRGRTLTANAYAVELSNADFERLDPVSAELRQDLRQVVGEHAVEQGYSFVGPISVTFEIADDLDTGMYRVRAATRRPDGSPAAQPASRGGYDPPSRSHPVVLEEYAAHSGPHTVSSGSQSIQQPPAAPPVRPSAPSRPAPAPSVWVDGREHRLQQGTTVFGRSANSADVVIDDPGMSRRHFEITVSGSRATATDLGSTNGTLVDGRPISSIALSDGMVLTAGDTPVTYSEAVTFSE